MSDFRKGEEIRHKKWPGRPYFFVEDLGPEFAPYDVLLRDKSGTTYKAAAKYHEAVERDR